MHSHFQTSLPSLPNRLATPKLSAPPLRSTLPLLRPAPPASSAVRTSPSALAIRVPLPPPPHAQHSPRTASASRRTSLRVPRSALFAGPPTPCAVSSVRAPAPSAPRPSVRACDPVRPCCDANRR